ncbi:MAG TPA: transcription elongation factor GreA [Nitrospirales bacterium]|nr:transcription elongation factor GreA [Nitrospirales bacterium]HIA14700.1 transcription elongation factor GreA [Nitrospirales bacterium]HIB54890.1 transcription elongation factor GreA [Nitrospirales bacterium]HIC04306.1 transcription elongation factor GreA [Nitrospirales bacterium]HIN32446.1 transcription elongation factor GreA [Nitrospirales bacterium]
MKAPITKKGYEALQVQLDQLIKEERPRVIRDIAEARSHGDLKENAEYEAAKNKQSFVEGKIQMLQGKLAELEIIDPSKGPQDKIVFGATVELQDVETDEKRCYTLVGQEESDLKERKISVQSPVGRALIGHRVGEEVVITTPAKTVTYEILSIHFGNA